MTIPTYPFYENIPAAADAPADDQPLMLVNNASIDSWCDQDHYSFGETTPTFGVQANGLHRWWRMPVQPSIPSVNLANSITGYSKTVGTSSQLFISPDTTGNEYQMTNFNGTNFASFSTYNAYGTPPANFTQVGGWTFLPGGMIVQYGSFYRTSFSSGNFNDGMTGTITFPRSFPNDCYLVVAQPLYNSASSPPSSGGVGTLITNYNGAQPTTTSFTYLWRTVSGGYIGFSWYAIGV